MRNIRDVTVPGPRRVEPEPRACPIADGCLRQHTRQVERDDRPYAGVSLNCSDSGLRRATTCSLRSRGWSLCSTNTTKDGCSVTLMTSTQPPVGGGVGRRRTPPWAQPRARTTSSTGGPSCRRMKEITAVVPPVPCCARRPVTCGRRSCARRRLVLTHVACPRPRPQRAIRTRGRGPTRPPLRRA